MEKLVEYIVGKWHVVKATPGLFLAVGMIFGIVAFGASKWHYDAVVNDLNARVQLRDDQIADLKAHVSKLEDQTSPAAIASAIRAAQPLPAQSAELDVQFFADERHAVAEHTDNVWRWYYNGHTIQTPKGPVRLGGELFVFFDRPFTGASSAHWTLDTTGLSGPVPMNNTSDFSEKYLVIGFASAMPAGLLRVHVTRD
jgi:hypothetical protein